MSANTAVPDAWDDDWEKLADKPETTPLPAEAPKLTKQQKRSQHQQLQKQLWDSAENPSRNLWLEAQGAVPLKQEIKAPMMLLSRKPVLAKRGDGVDDGEDSEEEARKKKELDFEERKRKAVLEREEKVRKYAEARERIMGGGGGSGGGGPASNLASAAASRETSQQGRKARTAKTPGSNLSSRPTSAGQSPARLSPQNGGGNVFDPEDMGRRLVVPRREVNAEPKEGEPSRQPRGPDGSGRGGFGFGRGGRAG